MKTVAIIGGGISGLAALHFLRHRHSDTIEPLLLEKDIRLGGTIGSDRVDGFVSEWGPNGFLDKVPLTLEMVTELGADDILRPADLSAANRYLYIRGKLHALPTSPPAFLTSSMLSLGGRLRVAREMFVPGKRNWDDDETIYDFAERRIGKEAAETLIGPMVSGIFGGNARKLSLKSCFPVMVEMERDHGSLVKAMLARAKKARREGKKSGGPAGPGGRLTSFDNGLQSLIERFWKKYDNYIRTGAEVMAIERSGSKYRLTIDGGEEMASDAIICSAPAFAAAEMIRPLNAALAGVLRDISYASISVVCLGYKREMVGHPLDGFGFLVPRFEGRRILGSIWTSSIFTDRAPKGMVQFRTMIGGATDPDAVGLSDEQLLEIVTGELKDIVDLSGPPAYHRIFRYREGIPQFTVGHSGRMEQIEKHLAGLPGFYLTGNAYDGVGLNDCVVRSEKVVTQLTTTP